MWDPSVFWYDGTYYAIMMATEDRSSGKATCGFIATSKDGVHWKDGWVAVRELEYDKGNTFYKAFIGRVGDRFIMNHGVLQASGQQNILRFYESQNLRTWKYLYSTTPDARWYAIDGRWDHMYVLPKDEDNPSAGYWGYPVATPKAGLARGLGMAESDDGREWRTLPPPQVEWTDVPPYDLEIGGCERVEDKYIIIGGYGDYLSDGYSVYTLISEKPCGPFRPDKEAYRLCGTSSKAAGNIMTSLAAWCHGKDNEKLISNYVSYEVAKPGTMMLPLRKPVFDDGHLRLGWWQGNESLKGMAIELGVPEITVEAEEKPYQIVWFGAEFDLDAGIVIEGSLLAQYPRERASLGFAFEEAGARSMEIRLGIGNPDQRQTHIGRYNNVTGFTAQDITGRGCATVTGIDCDKPHAFRLLVRYNLFELYIDDLLVQTYVFQPNSGRIGLIACNVRAVFKNLVFYKMI